MKITIFGSGYVGLVTGACLADVGNEVVCVDVDEDKIKRLNNGELPIFEPGLDKIISRNRGERRISFTTDAKKAVRHGQVIFIAVGTPQDEDGSADIQYVLQVAETIATHMVEYTVVVDKSTVPVGTAEKVQCAINKVLGKKEKKIGFDVVSNPEFLKEGAAIDDFMKPDRIVIGAESEFALKRVKDLYAPFCRSHDRLICMDIRSAEFTKYAANAMLATKISFINELSNIAERLGVDIEKVRNGIGSDTRIGYSFIYPGCGYGGSCFPKDVNALIRLAEDVNYKAELIEMVEKVNERQKISLYEKISKYFKGDLTGKTFTVWGLSFKPGTDDMRAAPSRVIMEALWDAGADVQVYDPEAMDECRRLYGNKAGLSYYGSAMEALVGANALVILTEWKVFRSPDFKEIEKLLKDKVLFDGRNMYEPDKVSANGLTYYAVGRGESLANKSVFSS